MLGAGVVKKFVAHSMEKPCNNSGTDLWEYSHDTLQPSFVYTPNGELQSDKFRRSLNTLAPRDEVLRCIEQRAQIAQDWKSNLRLEAITVQHYDTNGFFTLHHDFFRRMPKHPDRISTFNIYLEANCTGGGTHFPQLPRPLDQYWCKFIDCDSTEEGVVFKPIAGNAVYWRNLQETGHPYDQTLHQGMPVQSGVKIGMNIWTWMLPS
jgi:prolyl 4-hydroxylase